MAHVSYESGHRVRFAFVRSLKWIKGSGKFLPAAETPGYGRQPVGRYFIAKTIQLWQSPWKLNRHSNLSESLCYYFADLMLFSVQMAETFTKEITDGIGPDLRGILRGYTGLRGCLGIVTKMAVVF
jgi:hypothetical protein